jgi:hypothetical protein
MAVHTLSAFWAILALHVNLWMLRIALNQQ